jgi:uncharacterized protein
MRMAPATIINRSNSKCHLTTTRTQAVVGENGLESNVKHFAMGRVGQELSVVMPDQKTVYTNDDGSGKVFLRYVMTTPGDLSCGTLYAAKATQTSAESGVPAELLLWLQS